MELGLNFIKKPATFSREDLTLVFSSLGQLHTPYLNSRNGAGSCLIKKPAPFSSEDIFSSFGPAPYLNSKMELGFT